jgi:hypothetical protein
LSARAVPAVSARGIETAKSVDRNRLVRIGPPCVDRSTTRLTPAFPAAQRKTGGPPTKDGANGVLTVEPPVG